MNEPKFPLGCVVATPGALTALTEDDINRALSRHAAGDWGDVCKSDKRENEVALKEGFRLMSVYKATDRTKFWIITEADRSVTTLLLPSEY